MNEKEQAKQLLNKLQQLRHDNVEYKSLWRALGDCCETLNERIRVLELQERKVSRESTPEGRYSVLNVNRF